MVNENKYSAVIDMICEVRTPGKKTLQKLMYLMERRGLELNLNYGIHFYGPYSSKLDDMLHFLEAQDIIAIDTSGSTHKISILQKAAECTLSAGEKEAAQYVLEHFADYSPMELEAMTTLDYVANVMLKGEADESTIIRDVIKIKGSKFSEEELKKDLELLKKTGYVA